MVAVNLGFAHYWLDHIYGAVMHRLSLAPPFFSGGWGGSRMLLLEQVTRQLLQQGLGTVSEQRWPPPAILPNLKTVWESRSALMQEGTFHTPCEELIRQALPLESHTVRIRLLTPKNVPRHRMSCVLHLAGTAPSFSLISVFLRFFGMITILEFLFIVNVLYVCLQVERSGRCG
jgi:hypothetical protein